MGEIREHRPVLPILAAFSRYDEALQWARGQGRARWGAVALESPVFEFTETHYYEQSMGCGLRKILLAWERLMDPAALADRKHETNGWEQDFAQTASYPEARPLNLDPGYLTEAKLVLASTKDRDHRIYVGRGIFAENTLYYHGGRWQARPWTYPNYQRADYHQFLDACRAYLRGRYAADRRAAP